MKLVIIFGPPAVGKMTVGYELEKLTGLRVFHNHMTIEPILPFFYYGEPAFKRLVGEFRRRIFEEVAASDLPGMIFTFVWGLELESDKQFIDEVCAIFEKQGGEVCFVELTADVQERLHRNNTPFRLAKKPSKRDVESSRNNLLDFHTNYKLNTDSDFFYPEQHVKIDNTHLSPKEVADQIIRAFPSITKKTV